MSKLDWLSFVSVKRILLGNKCIIFGGAVRDAIFHKFQATQFYDECEEYLKHHPNDDFEYDDKKVSVNTLGRFTIPSDIDVFVYEDNYTNIISKLQEKYAVKIRIAKDLKYNIPNIEPDVYKLYKLEVYYIFSSNRVPHIVHIDMIVCPNDRKRLLPLDADFNVNSLLQTEHNIYVSPMFDRCDSDRTMVLYNIMDDIKHKIARGTSCNVDERRIYKMTAKGWEIKFKFLIYRFHDTSTIDEGETCTICTVSKNEFTECVNFKNCECKSIICMPCMLNSYEKISTCPTCRANIDMDVMPYRKNELILYKDYCS